MRVNVYAEEMTDRIEIISKEIEGQRFTWLESHGIPLTHPEVAAFLDYHTAQGTRSLSWPASWRTWLRNSTRFGRGRQTALVQPAPTNGPRAWKVPDGAEDT